MANNYTQWAEGFVFKSEAAAQLFLDLSKLSQLINDGGLDEDDLVNPRDTLDEEDKQLVAVWQSLSSKHQLSLLDAFDTGSFYADDYDGEHATVLVYSEEGDSLDALAESARVTLEVTGDTESVFTLTWATYCDKPRLAEFGGGWVVIRASGCAFGNVWDAVDNAVDKEGK